MMANHPDGRPQLCYHASVAVRARRNARNPNLFTGLLHDLRTARGGGWQG
jgi:hypothetical protein